MLNRISGLVLALLVVTTVAACGGKDEDFENARIHKCNIEKHAAALEADPANKEAADKLKSTMGMLEAVVDGAKDKSGLRAKLAKHKCT